MWIELTTKGFFSYETVSLMKHKKALEKVNNSKLPVLFLSKEKLRMTIRIVIIQYFLYYQNPLLLKYFQVLILKEKLSAEL